MNYLGRPNRVCDACQRMKAKCDKKSPSCTRCKTRGRTCVYSKSDPTFCSMNDWTEQNVQSRVAAKLALRLKEENYCPCDVNDSLSPKKQIRGRKQVSASPPPTVQLLVPLDWTSEAIGPFFDHFSIKSDALDSTWGWLPDMPEVYYNLLGTSSCLVDSVEACAFAHMANKGKMPQLETVAFKSYGRALHGLNEALKDPNRLSSDETLYAILLVQLFESIAGVEHPKEVITFHSQGKSIILHHRLANKGLPAPEPSTIVNLNRSLLWRDLAERNRPKLALSDWQEGTIYKSGLDEKRSRYLVSVLEATGRVKDLQEQWNNGALDLWELQDELEECISITLDAEKEYCDITNGVPVEFQPEIGFDIMDETFQVISPNTPSAALSNLEGTMIGFSHLARNVMRMQPNEQTTPIFIPRTDIYPTRPISVLWACMYIGRIHILRAMIDLRLLQTGSTGGAGDRLPTMCQLREELSTTITNICAMVPYMTSEPYRPHDLLIVVIMLHKLCDIPGLHWSLISWVIDTLEWIGTEGNLRMALRVKKYTEHLAGRTQNGL